MTDGLPPAAQRRLFPIALVWGVLAGLIASKTPAAPPAPAPPLLTSAVRFADNGNGTITDSLTGLIWLKNANCTDTVGGVTKLSGYLSWANALTWTAALANGNCGLSDGSTAGQWRLPNVNEWQSLVDYTRSNPALPAGHPFVGVQSNYYWSSTTYASGPSGAWGANLNDGYVSAYGKTNAYYVWPVRGGQ
ncbi:MAG: DUF1566 domain-containing protein [Candidatus Competibacteraceae bacterium]